jgi:hypothetical protein
MIVEKLARRNEAVHDKSVMGRMLARRRKRLNIRPPSFALLWLRSFPPFHTVLVRAGLFSSHPGYQTR